VPWSGFLSDRGYVICCDNCLINRAAPTQITVKYDGADSEERSRVAAIRIWNAIPVQEIA
jgi:hypothetical protein